MRKARACVLAILISLSIPIINFPSSEAGPQVTNVTMEAEPSAVVDVSPDSTGAGTIRGNVTCQTTNPATPVTVSLSAASTVGIAVISPHSMEFQGAQQSEDFQVILNVPLGTDASDEYVCTVTGEWQQGAQTGDITPTTTQVIVLPFSLCNIINTEIEKTAETGSSVSFTIELENQGNCDDVYSIGISNIDDLETEGITVDDISDVEVLQGNAEFVFIKAHISSDCKTKICRLEAVVTGTADEDPEEFRTRLNARIEEGHIRSNNPLGSAIVFFTIIALIVALFLFARNMHKKKKTLTPPNQ